MNQALTQLERNTKLPRAMEAPTLKAKINKHDTSNDLHANHILVISLTRAEKFILK